MGFTLHTVPIKTLVVCDETSRATVSLQERKESSDLDDDEGMLLNGDMVDYMLLHEFMHVADRRSMYSLSTSLFLS